MTIRVLVVDDSPLVREVLVEIIGSHADMQVVGVAADPYEARSMITRLDPDVVTLDVEMPRMSGLEFLQKLMRVRPIPVVMISAHTEEGSEVTLRALELGAVDFIAKPRLNALAGEDYSAAVAEKIRAAFGARVHPGDPGDWVQRKPASTAVAVTTDRCGALIAIGASTGGTEALRALLAPLPADAPPILVAQHMPERFTRLFAERLDGLCQIHVREGEHDEPVLPGRAYIAPGGQHMRVRRGRGEGRYVIALSREEPVNLHRPSVDVLFDSTASVCGQHSVGVILTGMGKDGAAGLLRLKRAGACTLAQNEASCVVFGMPREAIALGAVDEVLPLQALSERMLALARLRSAVAPV
jgi:two-component system chemotaxis response regulator CheB